MVAAAKAVGAEPKASRSAARSRASRKWPLSSRPFRRYRLSISLGIRKRPPAYNRPMRSTNRLLAASTLLLTLANCRTGSPSDRQVGAELDILFTTLHARGLFNGAVVVGRDGRITWQKGFGPANVAARAAFTPDTPADTASMAKTITAALVIALHHERKLDLDAPARQFLAELPYETVTLRHMLSHSSGLPAGYEYFERYLPPGEPRTAELFLSVLKEQKPGLAFPPGSAFEYNNLAFDLAALAAARAAGKPLGELLRERYFGPLSMRSAFLRPARLDAFAEPRTLGYRRAGEKTELHDVFDLEGFYGASNIYMSAVDLHRWNVSFLRDLHHEPLLREFAQIGGHPSGLTLGSWYRSNDGRMFSYAGHLQGFHTEVLRDHHHRTSVVYVSNNTLEPWLQHAVVRAANDILRGKKGDVPVEPDTVPVAKEAHDLLPGRWEVAQLGRIDIERSEGRLRLRRNGVAYPMFAFGPKYFYVPGLHFIVGFSSRDARFDSIYVSSNFAAEWGRREVAHAAGESLRAPSRSRPSASGSSAACSE